MIKIKGNYLILNVFSLTAKRRILTIIFSILLCLSSILLASNGIYFLVRNQKISRSLDSYCKGEIRSDDEWNSYVVDFLYIYSPVRYFFCQSKCPCKVKMEIPIGEQFNYFETSDLGAIQAQQCKDYLGKN